jgi:uncharacterized protein DUF4184
MPFTVAHAAAVLPFRKLNLVWSAFIIGSMAPDFPYVIGNLDYRGFGHRFPGIVWFTIPCALFALWMFHDVIKRPIVGMMPVGMQVRLQSELRPFRFGGASRFFTILVSIVLGIATHLAWDSVTHSNTWAYDHFSWLRSWVHVPFIGVMPVAAAMQYGSSVFGLAALAVWVLLWYRKTPVPERRFKPVPKSHFALAVGMFAIAGTVALIRAFVVVGMPAFRANANHFLLVFAVTAIALAFWQLLFYCVLVSTHQVWIIS